MAEDSASPRYFDPASLSAVEEPVQRYLNHALAPGAVVCRRPAVEHGRAHQGGSLARVRRRAGDVAQTATASPGPPERGWAPFGRCGSSTAIARAPVRPKDDSLGRLRFMHADDQDTARSAAGRAAVESIMDPASLLPDNGVSWQAEGDDLIVARFDVPPERAEVRLRINATGALRSVEIMRWGNVGQDRFGYIPFGGDIHAERRFGDLVLPSELTIGWWYGTARYRPFFVATIRTMHEDEPDGRCGCSTAS